MVDEELFPFRSISSIPGWSGDWLEEWDTNWNRVETLAQCMGISVGRGAFLAVVERLAAAIHHVAGMGARGREVTRPDRTEKRA